MAKTLNYRAPKESPLVPARKESAFGGQKYAESPISQPSGGRNLSPLNILTNAKNATVAGANKLQAAIYHVGRAKANGGNKGPR